MAKGRAFSSYLESAPLHNVYSGTSPTWNFLYEASTTRNPLYFIGDRVVMGDGRVFRYALTGDAVKAMHGCGSLLTEALGWTVAGVSHAVGTAYVDVTLQSRLADDLRGGYVGLYDSTYADSQTRGIIGNDASGATYTRVYLDAPLTVEIVASSDYFEVFENPYRDVQNVPNSHASVVGIPTVSCVNNSYVWLQTWGPISMQAAEDISSPANDARRLVFGSSHQLELETSKTSGQLAGFYLTPGSSAIAGPLIMLQISP